jgi:hypothetical protein
MASTRLTDQPAVQLPTQQRHLLFITVTLSSSPYTAAVNKQANYKHAQQQDELQWLLRSRAVNLHS